MSEESRRIVIDASIARAAGKTEHPVSKSCREFLNDVLNICHHVVMTPAIKEEWDKHQSNFTMTWRASMVAKKKMLRVSPLSDASVLESLKTSGFSENDKAAIQKDLHLIEAALETDHLIASGDDAARSLFCRFSSQWGAIRNVAWVNPVQPQEQASQWLHGGALPEKHRLLVNVAEQTV